MLADLARPFGLAPKSFYKIVRGEVECKTKYLYWNYPCDSVVIKWIDNDTVSINGVILEDINKDFYDWRRE